MSCEDAYCYCMSFPGAEETFPFDRHTLVIKVGGRMFAVLPLDKPDIIVVKCDPERALELREDYFGIQPAWHFNKKHWNMMDLGGSVPENLLRELITHSYELVVRQLPRSLRDELRS